MHSSRMRTGHSLTVCCSLLPGGVPGPGGCLLWGLVSGPEGCLLWGVSGPGGCLFRGSGLGAVCSRGCIPACTEADTLPPVDRILDTRL